MNIRRSLMVVIWGFLGVGLFLLALAPGMGASPAEHAMRQAVADPYGSITVCPGGACDYTTIQAAVDAASEGDTIKVAQGVYTSPAFQVVHITKEITVTGGYTTTDWANPHPLTQTTVLDAEGVARRRGVYIDGTGVPTITLSGLTIQRGHARGEGGGGVFVVTGTVVIQGSQVLSNTVRDYYLAGEVDYPIGGAMPHPVGGGVYMARGALILSHNTIQGNSADGGGGGAYLGYVVASLTGNTFLSNTVPVSDEVGVLSMSAYSVPRGGGIFISSATRSASLTHNVFRGNSALYGGGGAYVGEIYSREAITLAHNTFQQNSAGSGSGGGASLAGSATLVDNIFRDNTASNGGGGVSMDARGTLVGNVFQGNSADNGGGVFLRGGGYQGPVSLTGNIIQGNQAEQRGGGVFVGYGIVTMRANSVVGNVAGDYGGGLYVGETYAVHRDDAARNTANIAGGPGAGLILDGNTILSNTASLGGGGIAISDGFVDARNDILANNRSAWEGVHILNGALWARHWTLVNNGGYALTTSGGSATLTNTIVASHTVAGFWGTGITADRTLFYGSGTPCGGGATCSNSFSGAPQFLDPSAGDYHIGPGSAALDQGVGTAVMLDMDSQPRAYGAPDLGADEYWPPGLPKHVHLPLALKN